MISNKTFILLAVCTLSIQSTGCAQQQDQTVPFSYDAQNRQQAKENMKVAAKEFSRLADDFKAFYGDLREVVNESGISSMNLGMGSSSSSISFGATDIYLEDKEVIVIIDLPGIEKQDLNLQLEDAEILKLSVVRESSMASNRLKNTQVVRNERYQGSFSKSIKLPAKAKSKKMEAEYNNGILVVTIPIDEGSSNQVVNIPIK